MFSIVMKAYCILAGPSNRADENCLQVRDSNIVGNRVVLSLQICEIDTAADVLKTSFFVV